MPSNDKHFDGAFKTALVKRADAVGIVLRCLSTGHSPGSISLLLNDPLYSLKLMRFHYSLLNYEPGEADELVAGSIQFITCLEITRTRPTFYIIFLH